MYTYTYIHTYIVCIHIHTYTHAYIKTEQGPSNTLAAHQQHVSNTLATQGPSERGDWDNVYIYFHIVCTYV